MAKLGDTNRAEINCPKCGKHIVNLNTIKRSESGYSLCPLCQSAGHGNQALLWVDPNMKVNESTDEPTHYDDDGNLLCPRCKRIVTGWPVSRPDSCSPKHWQHCMRERTSVQRDWRNRARQLKRQQVKEEARELMNALRDNAFITEAYNTPQGWNRLVDANRSSYLVKKPEAERILVDEILQGFRDKADAEDFLDGFNDVGHNDVVTILPSGTNVTRAQLDYAIKLKWYRR